MDKKIGLILFIVTGTLVLIYLSMGGQTPNSQESLPLADLSVGARSGLPPGHPESPGTEAALQAPEFVVTDLDGNVLRLADLKGQAVLLNFWSVSCAPCLMEMPSLAKLNQLVKGKPIKVLALTGDSATSVKALLAEMPLDLPIYLDTHRETHNQFGVYMFPESFIIAPDGTVENHIIGAADWSHESVVTYLEQLAQAPSAPAPKN